MEWSGVDDHVMSSRTKPVAVGSNGSLYRREWPGLVRVGCLLTGSQAVAEELAQDAFVRLQSTTPMSVSFRPMVRPSSSSGRRSCPSSPPIGSDGVDVADRTDAHVGVGSPVRRQHARRGGHRGGDVRRRRRVQRHCPLACTSWYSISCPTFWAMPTRNLVTRSTPRTGSRAARRWAGARTGPTARSGPGRRRSKGRVMAVGGGQSGQSATDHHHVRCRSEGTRVVRHDHPTRQPPEM